MGCSKQHLLAVLRSVLRAGPREPGQQSAPRAAWTCRIGDRGPWKLLRLRDDQLPSHDGGAAWHGRTPSFGKTLTSPTGPYVCDGRKQQATPRTLPTPHALPYLAARPTSRQVSASYIFLLSLMAATSGLLDQIQRDNALRQHHVAQRPGECTDCVLHDIKLAGSGRPADQARRMICPRFGQIY